MIHESLVRKHTVGIIEAQGFTVRKSRAYGFVRKIVPMDKYPFNFRQLHSKVRFTEQLLPLSGFDEIFVRSNPPLDPVILNFLDSVQDDTFIVNDIYGLRKANNKLYLASFDDPNNEIIPVTYVSRNKNFLKKVVQESEKDKMILKPLEGYGGSGVIILEKSARKSISSLLDFYISGKEKTNFVILQEFVEGAEEEDIRVLMLNGQPLGAYKRVPQETIRGQISKLADRLRSIT